MLIVELSFILCIEVLFFVFLTFFRSSLKPSSIYFFVTKKKRDSIADFFQKKKGIGVVKEKSSGENKLLINKKDFLL